MSFRPQSERKPFANNMAEISTKAIMAFEETLNTADLAKTTSAASEFTDSLRQRITSQLSDEEPESQTCNVSTTKTDYMRDHRKKVILYDASIA